MLPSEVIQNIEDEDELEQVIKQINAEQKQTENGDEEQGLAVTSLHISSERKEAQKNLKKQAKRIRMIYDATHPPVDVAGNVILPIPDVDRAKETFKTSWEWYLKEIRMVCTGLEQRKEL
jgi:hypothetical protein